MRFALFNLQNGVKRRLRICHFGQKAFSVEDEISKGKRRKRNDGLKTFISAVEKEEYSRALKRLQKMSRLKVKSEFELKRMEAHFEMMNEKFGPCLSSFTTLLQGYANFQRRDLAIATFRARLNSEAPIDAICFTAAISAYKAEKGHQITAQQVNDANDLYQEAMKRDIKIDDFLMRAMAHIYYQFGDLARMCEFLDQCEKENIIGCGIRIHGYSKQGKLKEAAEFLEKMKRENIGMNTFIVESMMDLYVKNGAWNEILKLRDEMDDLELQETEKIQSYVNKALSA